MSVFQEILESLPEAGTSLEAFDRRGECSRKLTGREFVDAVKAWGPAFSPRDGRDRKVVALLFRPEETLEFLVAALAALGRGLTVAPIYPTWPAEAQRQYLEIYRLRTLAVGDGFLSRAEDWKGTILEEVIPVRLGEPPAAPPAAQALRFDLPREHPCAWIFTSGTSGKLARLTEISLSNLDAAVENIRALGFLHPGMTVHNPLSTSHIFALVAILGFLTLRPRRLIFSDVQYLSRLPQEKVGKIDAMILVPIVLSRMRAGFYDRLTQALDRRAAPPELRDLARIPLPLRRLLKKAALAGEKGVIRLETSGRISLKEWASICVVRKLFGRKIRGRLGSPSFVVVGGARPAVESMAFLELMGTRCLQGWGMTETTGPLAVCRLSDRFRGAFGTCGQVFRQTSARIEGGELVVEGAQVARGYIEPDGALVPFHGRKATGDQAEFDAAGRLKVLGKASDRITTENGMNYNPVPLEEEILRMDVERENRLECAVIVGDGRPCLGALFFLREGASATGEVRAYVDSLVREFNSIHSIDEKIGPWTVRDDSLRDAGFLGPSGKLVRHRVEGSCGAIYDAGCKTV